MTLNKISIAIALIVSITACNSTKKLAIEKPICKPLQLVKTDTPSTLDYSIDSCYLEQSCLHFVISYSGCPTDTFNLQWNGVIMKSMPPQLPIKLVGNANTKCVSGPQVQQLHFDLDTLKKVPYINSTFMILIEGWPSKIEVK